jgi:hypothetical protein
VAIFKLHITGEIMSQNPNDQGVIQVLLQRFNEQRLPRALLMKDKVDRGEQLSSEEVDYLANVLDDIHAIKPLVQRNPEYEPLVVKGLSLYKEITEKAIANAK